MNTEDEKSIENLLEILSIPNEKPQTSNQFFVYFNDKKNIVCISPQLDNDFSHFAYTKFPYDYVVDFLDGKKSPEDYILVQSKRDPTKFSIEKKQVEINHLITLDRFLVEIEENAHRNPHVNIKYRAEDNLAIFSINSDLRKNLTNDMADNINSEDIKINGVSALEFFFTTKNDPSFLVHQIVISTSDLIANGTLYIQVNENLLNTSLYTKKIFDKYSYQVIH